MKIIFNLIILFSLIFISVQSHEYLKYESEFLVNTYTTSDQQSSSVISLYNDDMFVITWQSLYQDDDDGANVYAQIFHYNGTKFGSEFKVNNYTTSNQRFPSITSLYNGDMFVITWSSYGQDGSLSGVYAQIFHNDGTKYGSEFQVNNYTTLSQASPSVASLSNVDMFVISWMSNQDGSGYGIYAQIFHNNGTRSGSEFLVNTETTSDQGTPSITSLSNGDMFVITWTSDGQDDDVSSGIYAQIFHNDGTKFGSEFLVNTYIFDNQYYPSVTSLSNRDMFVITWDSRVEDSSTSADVYAQIFHNNGTKSGSEFLVNNYTTHQQRNPSITSLSNDDMLVITWESYGQDGSNYGIYAQVFLNNGTKSGSEFLVNNYTIGFQGISSITSLYNGDMFVITWTSSGQDGDYYGIYAQLYQLSCDAGYFLNISVGSCYECPTGYYSLVGTIDACLENTGYNCYEKSKIEESCISCLEGFSYLDGECIECSECLTYSVGGTSSCLNLTVSTSGCDECSLSNDACNTCDPSYGFTNSSLCVACSECVSYSNGGESVCNSFTKSNCDSCSTSLDECLSCEAGYGFNSGTCSPCTTGTYNTVDATDICQNNTALNCATKSTIANECLSCAPNYGYDALLGTCTFCSFGTTDSSGTSPCNPCPANCTTCDFITLGCNECSDEEFRFSGPKGAAGTICVLNCPTDYFGSRNTVCKLCPAHLNVTCATCDSTTGGCTTCQEFNEWLSGTVGEWDTRCLVDCPEDEFKDIAIGNDASCVAQCPNGQYPDPNEICIDCDTSCVTCDTVTGGCLTCKEEEEWLSGPPGEDDTLCVGNCGDNVKDYATGTTAQCIKECPPGYSTNANEVCPTMPNNVRILIYLGFGLLVLIFLLFLIIFIGNRRKVKNQQPFVIITVFIAIYDFITDTLFLGSIRNESDVLIHFYIGAGLLITSLLVNFILLMRILVRHTREQNVFKIWLKDRTAIFGLIILISTTNLNVCSLWTSRLCGLRIFDAPLGDYEYQLKGLGIVSHVIEDIPQLMIQLSVGQKLYGLSLDELSEWPPLLILAMSATLLSLACGLFSRGLLLLTTDKKAKKNTKIGTVFQAKKQVAGNVPKIQIHQSNIQQSSQNAIQLEMPIRHPHVSL